MTAVDDVDQVEQAEEPAGLQPLPPWVVYLAAARDAMPGYAETEEAARRVRRQVMIPAPGGMAPYPDIGALAQAAVTGESVPADLGEQVLAADRAKAAEEARRLWTASVADRLEAELHNLAALEVDHALRFLDVELQGILLAARAALHVAGGIQTPEAALRAGDDQREAFVQIDELTRRLADLREAQRQVMAAALDYGSEAYVNADHLLRYAGTVANLAEVVPDWRELQRSTGGHPAGWTPVARPTAPWLPMGDQNPLVPEINRDHLVWLVESAAVPWVPTIQQARTATELLLKPETNWTEQDQKRHDRLADEISSRAGFLSLQAAHHAQAERDWAAKRHLYQR